MPFDLARDASILARTPGVIRAMLSDLDPAWTHTDYGPSTWSPHEILAHYIFGDQTDWIPRAQIILAHEGDDDGSIPTFEPFDRDGHHALCESHALATLLDMFDSLRAANVSTLKSLSLTPDNLARRAIHPALGEVTLDQLLCTWVVHDLHHIGHIAKAMAHQHRGDVGPWSAYLSVLDPPAPR